MELKEQIEDIWKKAEANDVGVTVATDEPHQLMNLLVEARLHLKRPTLFQFSLHVTVGKVHIIRSFPAVRTDDEYRPIMGKHHNGSGDD